MKIELLDILRCPSCKAENAFKTEDTRNDAYEIVKGSVVCTKCSARFPIHDGYCNLIPNPSREVRREQKAQRVAEREVPLEEQLPDDPHERTQFILRLPKGHAYAEEHAPLVRYAIDTTPLRRGGRLLDLGAGISWTTAQWAKKGCQAVSLDIYGNILSAAKVLVDRGSYFDRVLADMTSLPFSDGKFDVVFANAALHHTPDLNGTANEVARVLKPGGMAIFVNEPVAGLTERRRREEFGTKERSFGFNEKIYSAKEWGRALKRAKLTPEFKICSEGMDEKLERRKAHPSYQSFPRQKMLELLQNKTFRRGFLRWLQPMVIHFAPFNVVIRANKPIE